MWFAGLYLVKGGKNFISFLRQKISGKRIVILGQKAVGKTVLMKYLQTGELDLDSKATLGVDKIVKSKAGKTKLKELNLDIKLAKIQSDYAGTPNDYTAWTRATEGADIFVYLFDVSKWITNENDIERKIEKDLRLLSTFLKEKDIPIFLIGTHLDQIEGFSINSSDDERELMDDVFNSIFFKNMKDIMKCEYEPKIFMHIGSLINENEIERMIKYIITNVLELNE